MNADKKKFAFKTAAICISVVLSALALFIAFKLFEKGKYNILSIAAALLSCVPFFIRFERSKNGSREIVVTAVMTAFSVVGRLIFAPLPSFKPVSAIVIISGTALGPEAGFMVGSLSAIISNIFFGHGPWTPFQMFAWGAIGFLSGIFFGRKKAPGKLALSVMGVFGGVFFSLITDIWTTLSLDGTFLLSRYLTVVISSIPSMLVYAVSNVIFLIILAKPFLRKLSRIKIKYGVFKR